MAKLYFRYGTVGSAKTLNLLAVAHNYRQQAKKVLLLKPSIDNRFGELAITSRAGLSCEADYLLDKNTIFSYSKSLYRKEKVELSKCIYLDKKEPVHCIIVDEAQFLDEAVIRQLNHITITCNIPVICYGLKTDFKGKLFSGSRLLMEIADSIEEIKTTCYSCNKKATYNIKFIHNQVSTSGPQIDLGADEKYQPACKYCYFKLTQTNT